MLRRFLYHVKRLIEHCFFVFSNRNLKNFREKISASFTICKLYLRSIGKNAENEMTINFFDFKVTGMNSGSLLFLFKEIFLSQEYSFQTSNSKPKIVDCGSNIGASILFFKRMYPNAQIIGIEPNPVAFRLLERNIRDNQIEGVTLINCCLSDHEGTESFFVEKGGTNNLSGSIFESRGNKYEIDVTSRKLSSFLIGQTFDLIKIDVEGAERQIFNDLKASKLIECSDKYLMEYHHHPRMENILTNILDEFESKGYSYNLRADFRRAGSFQDILISVHK